MLPKTVPHVMVAPAGRKTLACGVEMQIISLGTGLRRQNRCLELMRERRLHPDLPRAQTDSLSLSTLCSCD